MKKKQSKQRFSKKRNKKCALSTKGRFGNQESKGSYMKRNEYPKIKNRFATGISFWKIPGWRENTKNKNAVVM